MATINEAKRISKRILLSNLLTNDYNLAITPLISGKHGIGKSQVAKMIAKDLGGKCITIEGGTLKEGEITGIPYQCTNEYNEIEFTFLPYYVIKRIQEAEKILNHDKGKDKNVDSVLDGTENLYSRNDLTFEEKIEAIKLKKVTPVIIFFDEINRTDNAVYRELMNIILTRTVNGYQFPWWVFIMGAMNPSTQNSVYATNEMDPAQLDRFIKIKVREDSTEWVNYALNNDFDQNIVNFIANNSKCLSENNSQLEDEDVPTPSPRGWEMVNLILKGKDKLNDFFTEMELKELDSDIKTIINSKIGSTTGAMFFTSLNDPSRVITAKDIFENEESSITKEILEIISNQSTVRNSITSKDIVNYLKLNINKYSKDKEKIKSINNKIKEYLNSIDNSSKLVLAQWLVNEKTEENKDIIDYLDILDIFDSVLLRALEFSNKNKYLINKGN